MHIDKGGRLKYSQFLTEGLFICKECLLERGALWIMLELTFWKNVSPSSAGWTHSFETLLLTRPKQCHFLEDGFVHCCHYCENLNSYTVSLCFFTLHEYSWACIISVSVA
jgi:hypothetical protein